MKIGHAERTLEHLSNGLRQFLESGYTVWEEPDGSLRLLSTRERIATINGLKIVIYSNEHHPPHFYVKSPISTLPSHSPIVRFSQAISTARIAIVSATGTAIGRAKRS